MGTVYGARPPSRTAYYVALVGVVGLLVMLCCYFLYFCIKRVKELVKQEYFDPDQTSTPRPPTSSGSYPVQPVVRDSASAMAKLCRQLPSQGTGDTVFPASTSVPAMSMDPAPPIPVPPPLPPPARKLPPVGTAAAQEQSVR